MEHSGAVFKLDLTEEARTQLQGEGLLLPHTGYVYATTTTTTTTTIPPPPPPSPPLLLST